MSKDNFTRQWITENAIEIIEEYEKGVLTLRGLHYRLVAAGMTNSYKHYKRVVSSMIKARWDGVVEFDSFSDHDRSMIGFTNFRQTDVDEKISNAKEQLGLWMKNYSKNRWENQPYYPEVFIEKKALQGVFQAPCNNLEVALGACKGYPSLTFLNESAARFKSAVYNGKTPIILYFGDYDPSGEDIPRSILANLKDMGCTTIELKRISLLKDQVIEWELPPAPAKLTDSRTANWDGLGQVELDAVAPDKLRLMCENAINSVFDGDLYDELIEAEENETIIYREELKTYVSENLA